MVNEGEGLRLFCVYSCSLCREEEKSGFRSAGQDPPLCCRAAQQGPRYEPTVPYMVALKGRRRILNHFYHRLRQWTVLILTLLESLLHVALFQQQRACINENVPTYVLTWGGTVHTDTNYCLKLPRHFFHFSLRKDTKLFAFS